MKKLLNTLYITGENSYLSLDGENVVISSGGTEKNRIPLHIIDGIIAFSYPGVSPALLGKCAEENKNLVFMNPNGKFLARTVGKHYGNVLLRREQYRFADNPERSLSLAKNLIAAKLKNSAAVLRRAVSDHKERLDAVSVTEAEAFLKESSMQAYGASEPDVLRGIEGKGSAVYFSVFDQLILQQKEHFRFTDRNRRPPTDPVNALLSFGYSLMTSSCVSALEGVGLDPYVGFFHTERPGRRSLALDLVEEFRAPFVDRFVLTAINKRLLSEKSFFFKEDGAVLLTDAARKEFLALWQQKKREELVHPYLGDRICWGLLPHVQAMLLAKFIRGDLDDYPPFLWK